MRSPERSAHKRLQANGTDPVCSQSIKTLDRIFCTSLGIRDLLPGGEGVAACGSATTQVFVVMQMKVAVHAHRLCDDGPLEIDCIVATATARERGFGRIERSYITIVAC